MSIVVVLRAVRDPASLTVNRAAQKIFIHRDEYVLNPADANALEAALRLAAAGQAVTALSYGEAPAEGVLRMALALGVSRAVLVRGARLGEVEAGALTHIVQRALERIGGAKLVLFGGATLDADLAQVAPRLATRQGWTFIEQAHELRLGPDESIEAVVKRDGAYRRLGGRLPAAASVALDSNQPRYPTVPRLITAYSAPGVVEQFTLQDLGLDEADLGGQAELRGKSFPAERQPGMRLSGAPEAMARQVAAALREA